MNYRRHRVIGVGSTGRWEPGDTLLFMCNDHNALCPQTWWLRQWWCRKKDDETMAHLFSPPAVA